VNDRRRINSPDLAIAFGKRLGGHIDKMIGDYVCAKVRHPSSGFSYARWNPATDAAFLNGAEKKQAGVHVDSDLARNPGFVEWSNASISALPSYGLHLPPWLSRGHSSQLIASNLFNKPASA